MRLAGLGPEGFAYLPCLCASPWASRRCRCGRLHGNDKRRESWDRRSRGWGRREGSVVRSAGSPQRYRLSHVGNGAFCLFTDGRCQAGNGGGRGFRGLVAGTRQKEVSDDFYKVGRRCFWLPGKGGRQAAHIPPPTATACAVRGSGERPRCTGQGGSTAMASTHQSQLGVFMRTKPFQGKKKWQTVDVLVSGFILSPSWLSGKLLSGVWPIFYFIIKGKNIVFSNVSARLGKSNI